MPQNDTVSFEQLRRGAASAQQLCRRFQVKRGDGVLLFDAVSPRLYAAIIGIMGLGAHVILVEPWMPLSLYRPGGWPGQAQTLSHPSFGKDMGHAVARDP